MPRYIDADKAKELWSGEHPTQVAMRRIFDDLPTADVVPKSEFDRLEEKCATLNEKNAQLALALFRDFPTTKELEVLEACEAVKKKVEREIISGIESVLHNGRSMANTMFDVSQKIEELKKKYTEDNK